MKKPATIIFAILIIFAWTSAANAQESGSEGGGSGGLRLDGFGVRAGVGTDINLGIAYGFGINKLFLERLEVGAYLYGSHSEETSEEGMHEYDETTDVIVFGVLANFLGRYQQDTACLYYLGGFGLGIFSVDWEEESDTDTSLGDPLPGGGSRQSSDGTAVGTIFNLGLGYNFQSNFDLRFEIPIFVMFSAPGEASAFVPTFTLTAGYRF